MGLDMYLGVKKRCYPKKGSRVLDLDNLNHNFDDYVEDEFGCSNAITIGETVGYWRKANSIHNWFVQNCQNGVDECQEAYVSIESIKDLLGICKEIVKRFDGKKMSVDPKTKEFWDKENAKAKEKGEKTPYKYKEEVVFRSKNLRSMMKSGLWSRVFVDCKNEIGYCKENLPPTEGFFFGSYEVDGGYLYDVIKTILILERLLKNARKWDKAHIAYDITYQASW